MNLLTLILNIYILTVSFSSNLSFTTATTQHRLSTEHLRILHKRSLQPHNEKFKVINVTFPCSGNRTAAVQNGDLESVIIKATLENNMPRDIQAKRAWELDEVYKEKYMDYMLRSKGGTFIKEYLAISTQKARADFPDAKRLRYRRSYPHRPPHLLQGKGPPRPHRGPHPGGNKAQQPSGPMYRNHKSETMAAKLSGKKRWRRQTNTAAAADDADYTIGRVIDESCSAAGTASEYDPNYLHLCSLCSAKRILPEDRYPNVINEVYCQTNNAVCLGGSGKCVDTIFNVRILKKKTDVCRLCLRDDEPLAVNEWELYIESIRVGCECMLDKDSQYRSQWFSSDTNISTSNTYSDSEMLGALG